jgi:RHS repeat-associated protein
MESGDGRSITWVVENKPVSITKAGVTTTYVYDGDGNRVKQTVGGVVTTYVNKYFEKTGADNTSNYYLGSKLIAVRVATQQNSTLSYILQDHLGSTAGSVAQNGTIAGTISYFSFGAIRASSGTSPTDKKFTGQILDTIGLYYYGARYYDPVIGRFISPDSIVPNPANPQSLNRYSYCLNNPLKYVDPSGHDDLEWESSPPPDYQDYINRINEGCCFTYSGYQRAKEIGLGIGDSIRGTVVGTINLGWDFLRNPSGTIFGTVYGLADGLISGDTINELVEQWNSGTRGKASLITDGVIVVGGFAIGGEALAGAKGTSIVSKEGIIYLRTNVKTGGTYIGQSKSYSRFLERQSEHARANRGAQYEFEELGRADPGKALDVAEQKWINKYGGPGKLENIRNQIDPKYWDRYGIK